MADKGEIVMTPLRSNVGKVMKVERMTQEELDQRTVQHIAGGPYKGIIINKAAANEVPDPNFPDSTRDFACYITDPKSKSADNLVKEKRQLRFWFQPGLNDEVMDKTADEFFHDLINPYEFPKDYIGYIKSVLTILRQFPEIKKMELEMRPPRPGEDDDIHLVRRQVTRVSQAPVKAPYHRGQEDHFRYQDGNYFEGEDLENGVIGSSSATPLGASLDRSARRGISQEDHLRQAGRYDNEGGYIEGRAGVDYAGMTAGAARTRDLQNGRLGPSQEDHLRQQGLYDAEGGYLAYSRSDSTTASPYGVSRDQPRGPPLSKRGQQIIWIAKKQRLLNVLEDAYPNILSSDNLIKLTGFKRMDMMMVVVLLNDLKQRGLIQEVAKGLYMRMQTVTKTVTVEKEGEKVIETTRTHDVEIVKNIPILSGAEQPTIAVITLLYCEKLAVDAMMDSKTTYVKYKTEGEGQVYTVGNIGKHKVVSTKLARIGYGEGAQVAAGNYVTRLLGTFNKVEHVFLLGVGGGIANYKNDSEHIRLGDIVVSLPEFNCGPIYIVCTGVQAEPSGGTSFNTQSWNPREDLLENITKKFQDKQKADPLGNGWRGHLESGFEILEGGETRFFRPPPETDKLMRVIDGELQEVAHPQPKSGSARDVSPDTSLVHYGTIGAGKMLLKDESVRSDFALLNGVKAVDPGFQAVMDSIEGNRKDSFAIIRGISDYKDGSSKKEWHPYASLAAAAFMKSMILAIPKPEEDD